MKKNSSIKLYFFFIFVIFYSNPSYAYLDPGMGSLIIQGIIGGIAAAGTAIVFYKDKFINFLKSKKKKSIDKNKQKNEKV